MVAKPPEPEREPSSSTDVPNWLQRKRLRDAELAALNDLGRELANRYPTPMTRIYIGTLRRPRPRRR